MAEDCPNSGENEDVECPVCLTARPFKEILVTKCDHKFCKSCLGQVLSEVPPTTSCPVCRQKISAFDTSRLSNGKVLKERLETIYGGVYLQGGTEGLASYHFNKEESYISYSSAPPSWRLDDGSAPPVKKPFLSATYDSSIRTFRAIVDWSDVNFAGSALWIYRIVFSEDFTIIEGGEVLSYGAEGERRDWHIYEEDLSYVRKMEPLDLDF